MLALKAARERRPAFRDTLDILIGGAISTSSSISLQWQPPTRNQDRITVYRVAMVSSTGLVKEVFDGLNTRCKVENLLPATDYVFSVKATYSDGSCVRSDAARLRTLS